MINIKVIANLKKYAIKYSCFNDLMSLITMNKFFYLINIRNIFLVSYYLKKF